MFNEAFSNRRVTLRRGLHEKRRSGAALQNVAAAPDAPLRACVLECAGAPALSAARNASKIQHDFRFLERYEMAFMKKNAPRVGGSPSFDRSPPSCCKSKSSRALCPTHRTGASAVGCNDVHRASRARIDPQT